MELRFTKELVDPGDGRVSKLRLWPRLYRIYDPEGELLSEYFSSHRRKFVKTPGYELDFREKRKWFQSPKFHLVEADGKQVGEIELQTQGISYFWKDVPSAPNALIRLGGNDYIFRRVKPELASSLIDDERWDHFEFILYKRIGGEAARFHLQMEGAKGRKPNSTSYKPFEGRIDTAIDDPIVLAIAFHCMEAEFLHEDMRE